MARNLIEYEEFLEFISKKHPVILSAKPNFEYNASRFTEHLEFLLKSLNLDKRYSAYYIDERLRGGIIYFSDEHSSGMFFSGVNADPTRMYQAKFPSEEEKSIPFKMPFERKKNL
jgi:hypothetical protein